MFWTKGTLTIRGGTFANNTVEEGGVLFLSEGGSATVVDGRFEGNEAGTGGGVVSVESGATLVVEGGNYSDNEAGDDGGAFCVGDDGNIEVRRVHAPRQSRGHPRMFSNQLSSFWLSRDLKHRSQRVAADSCHTTVLPRLTGT